MRFHVWIPVMLFVALVPAASVQAQLVPEFTHPKGHCCPTLAAEAAADQAQDWGQIGYYHEENLKLQAQPVDKGRVVFMGDANTEGWNLAHYFPAKPYLNRGISGQTTPQMLVRFYADVIDLHPAAVVIQAGENDIAQNTGPETAEMIEDNIRAMCDLAKAHDIKIILGQIPPVNDYTSNKMTPKHPLADIVRLNAWLRSYAAEIHAELADYYSVIVDSNGMLRREYSEDGAHLNDASYTAMAPVVETAIKRALR